MADPSVAAAGAPFPRFAALPSWQKLGKPTRINQAKNAPSVQPASNMPAITTIRDATMKDKSTRSRIILIVFYSVLLIYAFLFMTRGPLIVQRPIVMYAAAFIGAAYFLAKELTDFFMRKK